MKPFLLFFMFLAFTPLAVAQQGDVQINDLRVSQPIPGQTMSAGYFQITNHSDRVLTLIGVEANIAERVELHQSMNMNGMNHMRPLQSAHIQPGETLVFEPGGRHLMLIGVQATQAENLTPELTFRFTDGSELIVQAQWVKW